MTQPGRPLRARRAHQHALRLAFSLGSLLGCGAEPGLDDVDADLGEDSAAISGGTLDSSTAIRNAVVCVDTPGGCCTGTLVAPDIVITAGHCIAGNYRTNGAWVPATSTLPPVAVKFGPDANRPVQTIWARWFNNAPDVGVHADMILLGLDSAPLASTAVPRAVDLSNPGISSTATIYNVGYGPGGLRQRRTATSRGFSLVGGSPASNFACQSGPVSPSGASFIGGDSGSPVLRGSGIGTVMSVFQGNATTPCTGALWGSTLTFGTGGPTKPNLSAWLREDLALSACAATRSSATPDGRFARLNAWYSAGRRDYLDATGDSWMGCFPTDVRTPDYRFHRTEGYLYAPGRAQPAGTVALNLYWNATLADNAVGTAAPAAGYTFVRRLGYAFATTRSGARPLTLWHSATASDYKVDATGLDYRAGGYVSRGVIAYLPVPGLH